jgi:hypothetical protein
MLGVVAGTASPPTASDKAALVIFTVAWLVTLTRVRAWWRFVPSAPGQGEPYQWYRRFVVSTVNRYRPAGVVLGGFFVATGWFAILNYSSSAIWFKVILGVLASLTVVSLGTVISIWLYNRPRFLVPPALRREQGLWTGR